MKPYISIDIETTGLDPDLHSILQIALVLDIGRHVAPEDLPYANLIIKPSNPDQIMGSPFALQMNQKLLKKIAGAEPLNESHIDEVFVDEFLLYERLCRIIKGFKESVGVETIQVATKNPAALDIPMLSKIGPKGGRWLFDITSHRTIDVGSLWFPMFGYNPSLKEINQHLDREEVSHDAYEDALDNIYAIRAGYDLMPTKAGDKIPF